MPLQIDARHLHLHHPLPSQAALLTSSSAPHPAFCPPWCLELSSPCVGPWVLRWTCLLSTSVSPFTSPFAFTSSSSLHWYPLRSTSSLNSMILSSIRSITSTFSLIASALSQSPSSANGCSSWFDEWRCATELRSSAAFKCRLERGSSWMASAKRCGWIGVELDVMTVAYGRYIILDEKRANAERWDSIIICTYVMSHGVLCNTMIQYTLSVTIDLAYR